MNMAITFQRFLCIRESALCGRTQIWCKFHKICCADAWIWNILVSESLQRGHWLMLQTNLQWDWVEWTYILSSPPGGPTKMANSTAGSGKFSREEAQSPHVILPIWIVQRQECIDFMHSKS